MTRPPSSTSAHFLGGGGNSTSCKYVRPGLPDPVSNRSCSCAPNQVVAPPLKRVSQSLQIRRFHRYLAGGKHPQDRQHLGWPPYEWGAPEEGAVGGVIGGMAKYMLQRLNATAEGSTPERVSRANSSFLMSVYMPRSSSGKSRL